MTKIAELVASVLTALGLAALGFAMWRWTEIPWSWPEETPSWVAEGLRSLWGRVAGSTLLVIGLLMFWGSFRKPYRFEDDD